MKQQVLYHCAVGAYHATYLKHASSHKASTKLHECILLCIEQVDILIII